MDHHPLDRLRRSAIALPLAALAALVVIVINETGFARSNNAQAELAERGNARMQIQVVHRRLLDAETGQRGYLLTGRKDYLKPYDDAIGSIKIALERLHGFYDNDTAIAPLLKHLDTRVQQKLSELSTTLEYYDRGERERWSELLLSDIGREKMEEVRAATTALLEAETARIGEVRRGILQNFQLNRIGVNVMAAVALLAMALFLRKTEAFDRAQAEHARALQAERDQLETEVARRTGELTELTRYLQTVREDERARLARELHDELGALLTAAKLDAARLRRSLGDMNADVAERFSHINTTIDQGIALKRRIIEDLRPSSLSNLGLVAALEIQAKEFAQRAEIKVHTELDEVELDDAAAITVYRFVQEALTNIGKYAKAGEVRISMQEYANQVQVEVRDDGCGFDAEHLPRNSHGLTGMRYRFEAEGGTMRVESAPGRGTTVRAWLPLATTAAAA